jgi:serine/threonine protein kinase
VCVAAGDIKPDNVLVFAQGPRVVLKLADFSVAREVANTWGNGTRTAEVGTLGYVAPEVDDGYGHYGPPADIFSLGKVGVEIFLRGGGGAAIAPWELHLPISTGPDGCIMQVFSVMLALEVPPNRPSGQSQAALAELIGGKYGQGVWNMVESMRGSSGPRPLRLHGFLKGCKAGRWSSSGSVVGDYSYLAQQAIRLAMHMANSKSRKQATLPAPKHPQARAAAAKASAPLPGAALLGPCSLWDG